MIDCFYERESGQFGGSPRSPPKIGFLFIIKQEFGGREKQCGQPPLERLNRRFRKAAPFTAQSLISFKEQCAALTAADAKRDKTEIEIPALHFF